MRNSITYDFAFIVGHFWGCINRKSEDLKITMDIKEDYERSIKFWLKDKCIVKLNYISAETKTYDNKGGLQIEYPDRTDASINSCNTLINTYPQFFSLRNQQLNNSNSSRYYELRCSRKHTSPYNYYKQLQTIDKNNNDVKELISLLDKTQLKINIKRLNSGVGMSQCFGKYRIRKKKGIYESKNNAKYPDLYLALQKFYDTFVKNHLPEYTSIQVNKNYKTKEHYDRNDGLSYIIGLGEYTGGNLILNSYKHDIKYKPLLFNGKKWLHSTDDFDGTRYSLVFFKQNYTE
jgi:hypothetical protein